MQKRGSEERGRKRPNIQSRYKFWFVKHSSFFIRALATVRHSSSPFIFPMFFCVYFLLSTKIRTKLLYCLELNAASHPRAVVRLPRLLLVISWLFDRQSVLGERQKYWQARGKHPLSRISHLFLNYYESSGLIIFLFVQVWLAGETFWSGKLNFTNSTKHETSE